MTRRALATRALLPQLCLVLLLGLGLAAGLGHTIIWHRAWVAAPPLSGQVAGPPSANNSGSLQSKIEVRQLCEQILAGKLRVAWRQGEIHARNQCLRDGW